MEEAVGTIVIFSICGIIFGDEIERRIAVRMLIGALAFAFKISPTFAVDLVLAPFAMVVMGTGGLIVYIKRL